jgi:Mn-dependent DtxR family transcriptional regulator
VRLKDHGVSATYIKRMKERGYGDLTLDEYIRLRDRGERE